MHSSLVSVEQPIDERADRLLRGARRGEHLVPLAVAAAVLYGLSTIWSFTRPLGGTGGTCARIAAHPTPWVLLGLVGVVVLGQVMSRVAEEAGASPFWWLRLTRRVLLTAVVGLPLLLAGVEPVLAIMAVDAGSLHPATFGDVLVTVSVTPLG